MVSFADMITIMMSFFVIMFALASGEAAKGKHSSKQQQAAFDSLNYRFGPNWQPFASWGLMPGNSPVRGAGSRDKIKGPTRPVSDPAGEVKVLRKEQARIRVPGHGDRTVIGGIVFFDDDAAQPEPGADRPAEDHRRRAGRQAASDRGPRPRLGAGRCRGARRTGTAATWPSPAAARRSSCCGPGRSTRRGCGSGWSRPADRPLPATAAGPGEDSQVDIYLTDLLPEKYTSASAAP